MIGFLSGVHAVDLILAIVAVEFVVIAVYWRRTGRGIAPAQLAPNLLAGALLLIALRLVLSATAWPWVVACLSLAGIANVVDLRRRWR